MSTPLVAHVLELIEGRRRDELVDLVRAVAADRSLDAVVELLAAAQVEVGRRWQFRQWTVADEHSATAIVDLALTAATLAVRPDAAPALGTVVVTCVEEEWHVLPARMFAEQLSAHGWDVVFLGASTPADHLAAYLSAAGVTAVCLSCSVALHLPGARRSIEACHAAGTPALLGGAALGTTAARAMALGADAWANGPADASDVAAQWRGAQHPLATPAIDQGPQLALAALRPAVVDQAMPLLTARFPAAARFTPTQVTRTREDFDYILRYVEAALLTGDDSIMIDFGRWLDTVLRARGLPAEVIPIGLRVLVECLPPDRDDARRLLSLAEPASDGTGEMNRFELA